MPKPKRRKKVYKSYENFVRDFFPLDWKNRKKVCIYCHQEIKPRENEYEPKEVTNG